MTFVLPTNEECYRRLLNDPDQLPRKQFEALLKFSFDHDLLEAGFEKNLPSQFHELFWELYLPVAFERFGIVLRRAKGSCAPDFVFTSGGKAIYVEAVACGIPTKVENCVKPPNDSDDSDFEDGIAPDSAIMQRLGQAVSEKIKNLNRPAAIDTMRRSGEYCGIIAVNGNRAINGHPPDDILICPPFIVRTAFGLANPRFNRSAGTFWQRANRLPERIPIGHFIRPDWQPTPAPTLSVRDIAGILFSNVTAWHTALRPGDDFLYVQNPHGRDLRHVFKFCARGVWVSEGNKVRMQPR